MLRRTKTIQLVPESAHTHDNRQGHNTFVTENAQQVVPENVDVSMDISIDDDNDRDHLIITSESVRFWTGVQTLTLLNFLFEYFSK